jgi:Lon protease-like protein
MTLPNAILFPQAMLPLYIFEPRYRRMLSDALSSHRMFSIAMRKPGQSRETPSPVAGLGLIRASVGNPDGTSHLVLQGISRVELTDTVRYKPYRVQRIQPLETTHSDGEAVEMLTARVLDCVAERLEQGGELPIQVLKKFSDLSSDGGDPDVERSEIPFKELIKQLVKIENPDHVADLVSCALLTKASARQKILETANLEARLKLVLRFLSAEISAHRRRGQC